MFRRGFYHYRRRLDRGRALRAALFLTTALLLTAAFMAANPGRPLEGAAAAVCAMGLAGEIGWANMLPADGNATYRNRIIDAVYHMDGEALDRGAKYEIR